MKTLLIILLVCLIFFIAIFWLVKKQPVYNANEEPVIKENIAQKFSGNSHDRRKAKRTVKFYGKF